MPATEQHSVSNLLAAWGNGDEAALGQLAERVYAELRRLARIHLKNANSGDSLQPTALVNEAFLRLIGSAQEISWENRAHFYGIASRTMRLILVDHARARFAAKRGGNLTLATLDDCAAADVSPGRRAPDVLEIDQALRALAAIDERKARVIEMRYFAGMSREEVAVALGLTLATVKRDLRLGEAWLRRFLSGNSHAGV